MKTGFVLALAVSISLGATRDLQAAPSNGDAAEAASRLSLKDRVGFASAAKLLASEQSNQRQLGLERLGAVGTARALELLTASLEPGGAAQSGEERLVATRALARHAKLPDVQRALVRTMSGVDALGGRNSGQELADLVQQTAALALAASEDRSALRALARALRHEGRVADLAALALVAHPPRSLEPILEAPGAATVQLVELLERLGDQRAFVVLRQFVQRESLRIRLRAAVALTKLGNLETIELARHWLKTEKDISAKTTAAQILSLGHAPEAGPAIAALLENRATQAEGLELALSAPRADLVSPLAQLLQRPGTAIEGVLAALSRTGSEKAVDILVEQMKRRDRRNLAAYALALCPHDAAHRAIENFLHAPATRRLAARAAVLRSQSLDADFDGLIDVLEALVSSGDAADRAAGAFGLAVLEPERRGRKLLESRDPVVVAAAARQAHHPKLAAVAALRFRRETEPNLLATLAMGLASERAAGNVPTLELLERLESMGVAAPLVVRVLASRDSPDLRAHVESWLKSSEPLIRAHAAFGLGGSTDASAVGLLTSSYRFETAPLVRRAVVIALSQRSEPTRLRTLRLAAKLDPDAVVRENAELALRGYRLEENTSGDAATWLDITHSTSPDKPGRAFAYVILPSGLALPAASDPDGILVMAGLSPGSIRVRLAAPPGRGKVSAVKRRVRPGPRQRDAP
jgi:HEAT repeat protein